VKIIAFHNLKGGVGKTAAASNIAALAAESGIPTLLWDLDPQGAVSWYFGNTGDGDARVPKAGKLVKGKTPIGKTIVPTGIDNLDLIPADVSFRNIDLQLEKHGDRNTLADWLEPLGEDYGLVVLDCPPSLSRLAEQVFRVSDRVLVPLVPTWLSLNSWHQMQAFIADKKVDRRKFYPFWTMVDRRKRLHRQLLEQPPKELEQLMPGYIPYASDVERMGELRQPVHWFAPRSPAALAYRLLWRSLSKGKRSLDL